MKIQFKVIDISEDEQNLLMENIKKSEPAIEKFKKKLEKKLEKKKPISKSIFNKALSKKDRTLIRKEIKEYKEAKFNEIIKESGLTASQWWAEKKAKEREEAAKLGITVREWRKLEREKIKKMKKLINELAELKNEKNKKNEEINK